jgi:tRNA 5-methylaminomethyl-2-thiouridine biosynthesis bifunctional protein
MFGAPRSKQFDDVYFSEINGLEETKHVFLKGNDLPARWLENKSGRDRFVIAETGFGTGLNFLATWKSFMESAEPGQCLDFISFEKFPLDAQEIYANLQAWHEEFEGYLAPMIEMYPPLIPGFHRIVLSPRVCLTLVFDDVNVAFPQVEIGGGRGVDAWFLDGFKPSTNPDMWSDIVFENMTRLSREGTTFSTFTAAGAVRRGLGAAGFDVRKVDGFGSKRDMSVGVFGDVSKDASKDTGGADQ